VVRRPELTGQEVKPMSSIRVWLSEFTGQRRVFSVTVLTALGFSGFFGLVVLQPDLFAKLLGRETAGHISHHFREHHHRVHDLTYALLLGTAVVGSVGQLVAPKKVAGQLMALMPFVGLTLTLALTNTAVLSIPWVVVGASTLLATILHPTGRAFFSSFGISRVNRVMLALVTLAAVPLLTFASTNIVLQRTVTNEHAALGHYGFMAAFGFTVIGVGILASLRPDGWRFAAWVGGLLPMLLGLASLVFPDVESSLGLVWILAAIIWGITFVVAAELIHRRAPLPADNGQMADLPRGAASMPTWVYVLGSSAIIVLVLLLVIQHLAGGGTGHHT
jgi:hypothetical protein